MKTSTLNSVLIRFLLLAAPGLHADRADAAELKIGDAFPALDQFRFEGQLPAAYRGKVLLVDFWASWCAPCKQSFPALNELHQRYGEQGFVIIAISVDKKPAAMEAFLKKTPARFAVVRDADQKLVAAANVETMPTSFLVDRAGRVRFLHSGFKVDETKAQYVKEIEELLKQAAP